MAFKLGQNKAYLKTALDSLLGTVNGTGFKNGIIQQTAAGTFSALTKSTSVTAQSTDNEIPTAAAVKAAVDGATPVWGNITGTLSNQTDLNTVLTNTSTQIANLNTNKADKTALALTDRNLKYLAELTKGQAWDTEAGTTPAYQHIVASGAKAVAVDGIGGKTVVYNQLFQKNWLHSTSKNGITITVDSQSGKATFNGTATSYTQFIKGTYPLIGNHKYYCLGASNGAVASNIFGCSDNGYHWDSGSGFVWTSEGGNIDFFVQIQSGVTVNNYYVLANLFDLTAMGATSSDTDTVEHAKAFLRSQGINPDVYNAYSDNALVSANVTDATSMGKNLCEETVNGNIEASGRFVVIPDYIMAIAKVTQGQTYRVNKAVHTYGFFTEKPVNGSYTYNRTREITAQPFTAPIDGYIACRVDLGSTDIQIERASSSTAYSPYFTQSYTIPQSLRTAYPLRSAGSVYDEYDIENKKFIQRVGTRAYTSGDENNSAYTTDGTITHYPLSSATEVDISSYLTEDNVLTVEAGGTLTFTQSNSQTVNIPIPNDTVYAVNLAESV